MIDVDEVIATCNFSRQVRISLTAYDDGIGLSNRISSDFFQRQRQRQPSSMMTPLMMLRFRLGVSSVSRPRKQQTAASFISFLGVALRHSSSFIKAHNCIRLFFFFFSLFIYLHYDTTMSTYSSKVNFVPATLAGASAGC